VTVSPTVEGAPSGHLAGAAIGSPRFWGRLLRRRLAFVCVAYLSVIIFIAVVAPLVLPAIASEHAGDLLAVRQGPSIEHFLGTDTLGRDVLDRLLVGTRVTMLGVGEALLVGLVFGIPLGLTAGFLGGRVDSAIGWIADLVFSIPTIVIVIVVLSVFPQSMGGAMVTLGVIAAPGLTRVVRASTLEVREELYIAAARVSGLSRPYIITRHVLPRIAGPVIVQASLLTAVALLVQTGLAFLSLVVASPAPSWGGMVADGAGAIELQPWLIWPPGMAIALTILALGFLGDAVRDTTAESWSTPVRPGQRHRAMPKPTDQPSPLGRPAAQDSEVLLSIQHLSVAFGSPPVRVVEDVSFDVRVGEVVGMVGESGSGKSVTCMSIFGLLSEGGTIETGRILFAGRDLVALPERRLRQVRGSEIGLISQEPMISLNPALRVGSQLAEALRRHKRISHRDARRQALALLRRAHLPEPEAIAHRYPHELSGGMAQRVAIARALAGEPRLLIADEPTTALDVTVQAEILELLRELQAERRMAILLVTHDWGVVADICDRAVVMYAGQVVERAALIPMFREPLHPYTEALLASNPHKVSPSDLLPVIPGGVPKPGAWPIGCHFHPRCRYATVACREHSIPLEQLPLGRETRCIHHEQVGRV
jgi:peptide/nickel transport system permease protein